MMQAVLTAIEYYTPSGVLTNEQLAHESDRWTADKILAKTGIASRHIADDDECASDLAVRAAEHLFASGVCLREDIDYLILNTQSPDYFLPTTACLVQDRLGLSKHIGALDFNLGCSGYLYGLGLAKGLIESRQARRVLLITAETYSKFISPESMDVRTLFGDAAAATLIVGERSSETASHDPIGPFVYGTDGSGAGNLIVEKGGSRSRCVQGNGTHTEASGNGPPQLVMDGPEIFAFTLDAVPSVVEQLLDEASLSLDDVDLFVFHQANQFMLEHLRAKIGIPKSRFVIALKNVGNTVSSTIPIALCSAQREGRLREGHRVMLVGFGVGYSWGATLIRWRSSS